MTDQEKRKKSAIGSTDYQPYQALYFSQSARHCGIIFSWLVYYRDLIYVLKKIRELGLPEFDYIKDFNHNCFCMLQDSGREKMLAHGYSVKDLNFLDYEINSDDSGGEAKECIYRSHADFNIRIKAALRIAGQAYHLKLEQWREYKQEIRDFWEKNIPGWTMAEEISIID